MKWCVLIKPIGIKEPIGIYCNTGFDYFGESEEYIDHDYRDKVKTHYKGMSAAEMGTSHKRKSRRQRKR